MSNTELKTEHSELLSCPFCGSSEIDPEGVSSIKPEYKDKSWSEVTPNMCHSRPCCDNCGASTDVGWNTRPVNKVEALTKSEQGLVKALEDLDSELNYLTGSLWIDETRVQAHRLRHITIEALKQHNEEKGE